ncbi:MAG: hypothetical protein ACRCUH_10750 [Shewanella sp.]
MATIDIRAPENSGRIAAIVYGGGGAQIEKEHPDQDSFNLYDSRGRWLQIDIGDVNNLLLALDKAKELGWFV